MCQSRWKARTNVGGCPSSFHVVPGVSHSIQAPYTQSKATPLAVKEQTVESARFLWPLLFSRLFEVTTLSGKSTWCYVVGEDWELLLVASMAFTLGCLLARPPPSQDTADFSH